MVNEMRISRVSSEKEQRQLELCQQLIVHKSYRSQEQLRCDLKQHGFEAISQSTVSRLLKLLGVIKRSNAKGEKIYALNPMAQPQPSAARSVAEMVISVEHNSEFIMIHTVSGYGRAVAKILDHHAITEILGVVSGSSVVWIAPRDVRKTPLVHRRIMQTLGLN
ncbi:arginine repressor protein [Cedecea davisae DSM 4568]|uniref:Arginine repressor n=2 Tax=Cedecea davisae TaxID=158484 RepID=S3IN43_9ENTR|nr:arginine repressor protein [Cedecea davisae DSM 4568]